MEQERWPGDSALGAAQHVGQRLPYSASSRSLLAAWRGLADYLMRRWSAGPAVALDDVVQELLVGAWRWARASGIEPRLRQARITS